MPANTIGETSTPFTRGAIASVRFQGCRRVAGHGQQLGKRRARNRRESIGSPGQALGRLGRLFAWHYRQPHGVKTQVRANKRKVTQSVATESTCGRPPARRARLRRGSLRRALPATVRGCRRRLAERPSCNAGTKTTRSAPLLSLQRAKVRRPRAGKARNKAPGRARQAVGAVTVPAPSGALYLRSRCTLTRRDVPAAIAAAAALP